MGCNQSAHTAASEDSGELRRSSNGARDGTTASGRRPGASSIASSASGNRHGKADTKPGTKPDFRIQLVKCPGDLLGAGLGNTSKGAVIFSVKPGGILDQYNKDANDDYKLSPGLIIQEVNGVTGYWEILEELRKLGTLDMKISSTPPARASPNWFEEIATMGKDLEAKGSPFMVRLQPQDPKAPNPTFSSLPHVRAGDVGVDQCAICLEDVEPDRGLVQLPCKHAFHALCTARWLTQSNSATAVAGKRQCCPLCCRQVVGTSDGNITTQES